VEESLNSPQRPRRRFSRKQKAQSIVEFAFSLPFLLVIVLGILEMGLVFTTYVAVVNAAHEGAVFASMYPQLADSACGSVPQTQYGGCTGANDNTPYGGSGNGGTLWNEYFNRISSESFVQPGQVLVADGMISSGVFYPERPVAPTISSGSSISVTVHYTITTLTSGMSLPFFGRLGLPNAYHIHYGYSMPIRATQ
jgi:Flp pilus assembly protein TadG